MLRKKESGITLFLITYFYQYSKGVYTYKLIQSRKYDGTMNNRVDNYIFIFHHSKMPDIHCKQSNSYRYFVDMFVWH